MCLTDIESLKYVTNAEYQATFADPKKVSLVIMNHACEFTEEEKKRIGAVYEVTFNNTGIEDLLFLEGVEEVNLMYCRKVQDLTALKKARTVRLTDCPKVVDVSPLKDAHTVLLSGCNYVTDVSALENVTNVKLKECMRLTDVRSLNKVPNLIIDSAYIEEHFIDNRPNKRCKIEE